MPTRRTSELDARLRAAITRRVEQTSNKAVAKAIGRNEPWLSRYRNNPGTQPDIPTLLALMRVAGWTLKKDLSGVVEPSPRMTETHTAYLLTLLEHIDDRDVGETLVPVAESLKRHAALSGPTSAPRGEVVPLPTRASRSTSARDRRR